MNENVLGILLTCIAGFSTVIGALIVVFNNKQSNKKIATILGFSIGIIIMVVSFDLLPEALDTLSNTNNGIPLFIVFILIGIVLTNLLDKIFHHDEEHGDLHHVGLITTLAVSVHKLPEGIVLFLTAVADPSLGIAMTLAIAIHHLPEGMMIALPVYYDSKSKVKAIKYAAVSGSVAPFGAVIALLFFNNHTNETFLGCLFAVAIGMFVFIVFKELLPTAFRYKYKKETIIAIGFGLLFMGICSYVITLL